MNADMGSTRACCMESNLAEEPLSSREQNEKCEERATVIPTDLDVRYEPNSSQDKEDDTLTKELKKKIRSNRCTHQMLQRAC